MLKILQRLTFPLELLINGSFIILTILLRTQLGAGLWDEQKLLDVTAVGVYLVPLVVFFVSVVHYLQSDGIEDYLRRYLFSLIVMVPLLISWGDADFAFWLGAAHLLSSVLALFDELRPDDHAFNPIAEENIFDFFKMRPAQLIFVAYAGLIFLGAALLMMPFAANEGYEIEFVDALFTSASALCITGLVTLSVVENYSLFGQVVIISLVQIGGLSIMTLYSSLIILLGKSLGTKDRVIMQDVLDVSNVNELFTMIISIVKYTFIIELWGAILLTIGFTFEGIEFSTALYYGVFHSISAFCQGGFTLFHNSFADFSGNTLINFTLMTLIICGSLGFIVLKEVSQVLFRGRQIMNMGLHSKVVLITTFALAVISFLIIFFGEFLNALDGYSTWEKVQIALFQSLTMRSAGLSTIDLTLFQAYTLYAMTLFMFIGGGSGSCAGGIKVTTFAIMAESVIATLRGQRHVTLLDRKIPGPIVVRAVAITFLYLMIITFSLLVLIALEAHQPFLVLLFEVVSATGTVGLSLGVTEYLSSASKLLLCFVMLVGRIGPLTVIVAISQQRRAKGKFDYPDGRIMIG